MDAITHLIRERPAVVTSLDAAIARARALEEAGAGTFERAVVGGFEADRVAFAFGAGYLAALPRRSCLRPHRAWCVCCAQAKSAELTPPQSRRR